MTVTPLLVAARSCLTADERKRHLADLHGYWHDIPPIAQTVLLATFAPGLDPAKREYLWDSYREARALEADLRTGWVTWDEAFPDLLCEERQETAAGIAASTAYDYLHELTTGETK